MENQYVTIGGEYHDGTILPVSNFLPKGSFRVLITFLDQISDDDLESKVDKKSPGYSKELIQSIKIAQYHLSAREYEILNMVKNGLTNREIAEKLELGDGTVRNYVSSIIDKLKASNRTQAVTNALNSGLLSPDNGED